MRLLELFVRVDDLCSAFEDWAASQQLPGTAKRDPESLLSAREVMTIVIHLHQAGYRDFKSYYQKHVCRHLVGEFPRLVCFIELMPGVLQVLCACLQNRFGRRTGIAFFDSTLLAVYHNRRIARHKMFENLAARGKNTMGWFYGFRLQLIVSESGELPAVHLTPSTVDDRKPLGKMTEDLFGQL